MKIDWITLTWPHPATFYWSVGIETGEWAFNTILPLFQRFFDFFFGFLNCSDNVVFFAFHLVENVQFNFYSIQFVLLNHRLGPTMKNRRYDRQFENIDIKHKYDQQ